MNEYALIETLTNTLREYRNLETQPPDLPHKNLRWLPVVVVNPTSTDAQVKEGPVVTVEAEQVTRVWTVRDKTPQEIDDDKTAQVDAMGEVAIKGMLETQNVWRVSVGLPVITEAQLRANLKSYIGSAPLAPDMTKVAVLRGAGAPAAILKLSASITIGALTAANSTDKTFTVNGLLITDTILSVTFPAGLTPTTISYTPLRVSAANTMVIRFNKISTGAVTPPAPQVIEVMIAR